MIKEALEQLGKFKVADFPEAAAARKRKVMAAGDPAAMTAWRKPIMAAGNLAPRFSNKEKLLPEVTRYTHPPQSPQSPQRYYGDARILGTEGAAAALTSPARLRALDSLAGSKKPSWAQRAQGLPTTDEKVLSRIEQEVAAQKALRAGGYEGPLMFGGKGIPSNDVKPAEAAKRSASVPKTEAPLVEREAWPAAAHRGSAPLLAPKGTNWLEGAQRASAPLLAGSSKANPADQHASASPSAGQGSGWLKNLRGAASKLLSASPGQPASTAAATSGAPAPSSFFDRVNRLVAARKAIPGGAQPQTQSAALAGAAPLTLRQQYEQGLGKTLAGSKTTFGGVAGTERAKHYERQLKLLEGMGEKGKTHWRAERLSKLMKQDQARQGWQGALAAGNKEEAARQHKLYSGLTAGGAPRKAIAKAESKPTAPTSGPFVSSGASLPKKNIVQTLPKGHADFKFTPAKQRTTWGTMGTRTLAEGTTPTAGIDRPKVNVTASRTLPGLPPAVNKTVPAPQMSSRLVPTPTIKAPQAKALLGTQGISTGAFARSSQPTKQLRPKVVLPAAQ